MAQLDQDSRFMMFILNPEELMQGIMLNEYQKMHLRNRRSMYAELKINLRFNPADPLGFAQEEAELRAKIDLISELLEHSDAVSTVVASESSSG